jgi:protein-tyrosine phosphatase
VNEAGADEPGRALRILFVCTGNVCRSPVAERLLRTRLQGSDIVVASAGLQALAGQAIDPPTATALRELGVEPGGHLARQATDEMLRDADLVLTAEIRHRSAILSRAPQLMRRTFALVEFAELAGGADVHQLGDLDAAGRVERVAARRGRARLGDVDIDDPYQQSIETARVCVARIDRAVVAVAALLERPGGG